MKIIVSFLAYKMLELLVGVGFQAYYGRYGHPGIESIIVGAEKPPIPKGIIPLIGSEMYTVYVYGKITYKDAFGQDHWTRYRFKFGGDELRTVVIDGFQCGRLQPDTEGNGAN